MRSRRLFILVVALALAGCDSAPPPAEPPAPPARTLRLGVTPFAELPVLYRETRALADYLAKNTSRRTRPVLVSDYRDMLYLLHQDRLDLAWCTPTLYARARGKVNYDVLCNIVRGGKSKHTGLIVVRADSPYRTLADLKGTTFDYVDRGSATGFVLPNLALERAGIEPLSFFHEVRFALNHTNALDDLLAGRCDAAAVHDDARSSSGPIDATKLRILAITGESPADPILVSRRLGSSDIQRLRELFVEMAHSPGGAEALAVLTAGDGITGFGAADDRDYRSE